jgi:hypothetical protein
VLLGRRGNLSCYRLDGTTKAYPEPLAIIAVYPDGILLRDWSVCFVPLRDGDLDMQKKVEVIPVPNWITLRSALPRAYKPYPWEANFRSVRPLRHADSLVWIGETGLEVFDLHDGKRSQTPLHGERLPRGGTQGPAPFQPVTAYDGETAVSGTGIYDAKTGKSKRLPQQHLTSRSEFSPVILAVRHGIGYCFASNHLMAVDLTVSSDYPFPRQLLEAQSGPVAETDKGLIVWNGKKWTTVPWLAKW